MTKLIVIFALLSAACSDDPVVNPDFQFPIEDFAMPPDLSVFDLEVNGDLAGFSIVEDCMMTDYIDDTAEASTRLVAPWDTSLGKKCLQIKVGQTVIWSPAPSTSHPLEATGGSDGNPIMPVAMNTFMAPGFYGYDCGNHHTLMHGAIWVVP